MAKAIPEGVKVTLHTDEKELDQTTAIADIVLKHDTSPLPALKPGKYTITIETDDAAK